LKLDSDASSILTAWNPISWLRAFKRVKAQSPEVIIFQWWQPFFGLVVGTLARFFRLSRLPVVIECHNIFPHEGNPLDGLLTRFGLSTADHLITHSNKDREDLLSVIPGKRVSVYPLPILDEFANSRGADRSGRTLLFFGKVRKYKGLEVLLAAMPKVLSKVNCELNVVGEFYDPIEKYQNLIRKHHIENRVHIENRYVSNEEVPRIFERADVLVLPYVSATQSAVARIALSNALPVIASRTGGLSETIIENVNGLLFPPEDAEALADAIVTYFTKNLGPIFSENIRNTSAEATNHRIGNTIEEIMLQTSSHARVPTPS
jgi:glycosyltransferase involved in cell wall biosynthesis